MKFRNNNENNYLIVMQYIYGCKRLLLLIKDDGDLIVAIGAPLENKGTWEHGRYYDKNDAKIAMNTFFALCEEKNEEC